MQKIGTYQRLSACQTHTEYTAFRQHIRHTEDLLIRGTSVLAVGRRHKAVSALQIAFPGNGPVYLSAVTRRIGLVLLLGEQKIQPARRADNFLGQQPLHKLLLLIRQFVSVDLVISVAVQEQPI